MNKIFKILLAIGGIIAGIFALLVSQNKLRFNKRTKANKAKLDLITSKVTKVKGQKKSTKDHIKKNSSKIKLTKSKVKSTKNANITIDNFEKKYKK